MATLGKVCTDQPRKGEKMAAFESKKYSWKSGYSYRVSAETVGNVLEKIEQRKGSATSEDFLEYSRSEDAETHEMFEWDDAIAAEKYRLRQSAQIINQLQIEITYEETQTSDTEIILDVPIHTVKTSAFVNVGERYSNRPTEKATYVNVIDAMKDVDKRKQVLKNASASLEAFKQKYKGFKELDRVIIEIDNFQRALEES